jgi:dTDP-glucose 4,6-dehydratase
MRIIVTGGAGFLGSHLCKRLVRSGHQVIAMDNLLTGSMSNIENLLGHEHFTFIKYNVCQYLHVDGCLDAIAHFASPASPQDYLEFPIATLKVGALGTHQALGLAKAKKARLLLASTSEVYGDPLVSPQHEGYWGNVNPISPRGVYDEAKRFAEAVTMAYHRYHGLDTRILRIFNTYGPFMRPNDGRVVSNFIVQTLSGKPITIYGEGKQTRSFCYVDDLVDGIYRLLMVPSDRSVEERTDRRRFLYERERAGKWSVHDPINLGNPQEFSVLELAQKVQQISGKPAALEFQPLPADDPQVRRPDIARATNVLGWKPHVTLEQGLRETIRYFEKNLSRDPDHSASPVLS